MKNIEKIIENAAFTDSVLQESMQKHSVDLKNKINNMLVEKAQELGISLYSVCASYVPEVTHNILESDWRKEHTGFAEMGVETTIRLVRRDNGTIDAIRKNDNTNVRRFHISS